MKAGCSMKDELWMAFEKILDDERIIVEEPNEIKKHWFL